MNKTNDKTIKNMQLILNEINKGITNGDVVAVKILSDAYNNLLKEISRLIWSSVKTMEDEIIAIYTHKEQLESFVDRTNEKLLLTIGNGRHRDSHDYTIILERFNKSLSSLRDFDPIVKHCKRKKKFIVSPIIQDLLDASIKTGTLVNFYDETHRGMGKTTALIKKAHELDAVLVAGLEVYADIIRGKAEEMGLNVSVASIREMSLMQNRSKAKKNGYLVDEMVDMRNLKGFSGYKLLGGFSRVLI